MDPGRIPSLPAATASAPHWVVGVRTYVLATWRGRLLLSALAVAVLETAGLRIPVAAPLARVALWLFGLWFAWRIAGYLLRRLLWRIRTKLLLSYLFVAVVPVVLLVLFFATAGLLLSGLIASHLVSAEIEHQAAALEALAREALAGAPDDASAAAAIRTRLAAAPGIHPDLKFALARGPRLVAGSADVPSQVPDWLDAAGFSGLVRDRAGEPEVVRALWREGDRVLVVQAPLDEAFFAALRERMGIRLLTAGGSVETRGGGLQVHVDEDEVHRVGTGADLEIEGMAFFATPARVDWRTGERQRYLVTFSYRPYELVRRLSPGALNTTDRLVQALGVLGVVFLVMYGVALLFGFALARSVTHSVHALSRGTQRLRAGDFAHPIQVRSRDQLGELAESFNTMARDIQALLLEQAEKERLEEELRIARRIQMSLLPQDTVQVAGLRIAALCLPAAEVGGDYYDLLPLGPTRMGVLVADVSGKGTSAALYMAELKGLVLSLSRIHDSPARLLADANRILSAGMDARTFVTMTYAVVDVAARRMRYARAGHSPIIQFEARTGVTRILAPPGLGLGLDPGDKFEAFLEEAEVPLECGDILLFFTDGLSEAMNERAELFGEARLREVIEGSEGMSSEEIKQRILAAVREFVGEASQHDDMTLVILKVL